jgi:hypothetical protein
MLPLVLAESKKYTLICSRKQSDNQALLVLMRTVTKNILYPIIELQTNASTLSIKADMTKVVPTYEA